MEKLLIVISPMVELVAADAVIDPTVLNITTIASRTPAMARGTGRFMFRNWFPLPG